MLRKAMRSRSFLDATIISIMLLSASVCPSVRAIFARTIGLRDYVIRTHSASDPR